MKRYCTKCKDWVDAVDGRQYEAHALCGTCGDSMPRFSLRQRAALRQRATGQGSLEVRRVMWTRGGQVGSVIDTNIEGASLDFFGEAPSIEFWDWDELEVGHLLDDTPLVHGPGTAPTVLDFACFKYGDSLMFSDGRVAVIERFRMRGMETRFEIRGNNVWRKRKSISRRDLASVVDWLGLAEYQARTITQWKSPVCPCA
jgi:hypothetical protein